MKRLLFFLAISVCLTNCVNPPEKKDYIPFECLSMPVERTYFPEETVIFEFNMDINPLTSEGFSAVSSTTGNSVSFKIEKNILSLTPPLPANDTIEVSITSQLKSIDNRPLQIGGSFTEEKKTISARYSTGNPIPEIVTVLPDSSQSASVAVRFSSPVSIQKNDVEPGPENIISLNEWQLFVFKRPEKKLLIKKAKPPDREESIENILITLSGEQYIEGELEVLYEATDKSISVIISDESAVAASVNGLFSICERKCTTVISDLEPSEKYKISIEVFTASGVKISDSTAYTGEPVPHIMISEIMHTPAGEPEKSYEFVELYNYSDLDFDLSNCFIDDKADGSGKDPLTLKNLEQIPLLEPGSTAIITGNEADFSSSADNSLWFVVDDTTVADAGLTSNESVQIVCVRNEEIVTEDSFDPSGIKSDRGYSVNIDVQGSVCTSSETGGTPGIYYDCP